MRRIWVLIVIGLVCFVLAYMVSYTVFTMLASAKSVF